MEPRLHKVTQNIKVGILKLLFFVKQQDVP